MLIDSKDPHQAAVRLQLAGPVHGPAVLTTWKEVARYMGKGVRTVQRWERDFALPVRRPPGSRTRRAILALTSDLDAWIALSCARNEQNVSAESFSELSRSLRKQVRLSVELRIANRILLNEIHIAMQALRQNLTALCPPPAAAGEALIKNDPGAPHRSVSTLLN